MSSVIDPRTGPHTGPSTGPLTVTGLSSPEKNGLWPRAMLLVALALAALLALFHDTAWSMIAIWYRSETFAHGFLILPMSLWMIYTKRAELAQQTPQPCWPALVLLAGAGLAWLVGEAAGVVALGQAALVAMLLLLIWAVLGTAVARLIAFPLLFLFFMVPVGDFLMDPLIDQTADFTVSALRLTGIPVFREGNHFSIPSGSWSVVEACSGLRYLIASITLGCLFAYLSYRTLWRRAAFIVASMLVPIVANWVRAYMIVMLAHLSSNRLATGVDHLIYGWVFFGLVMMLLFWVGSIWREDLQPASTVTSTPDALPEARAEVAAAAQSIPAVMSRPSLRPLLLAAVAALALLTVWRPILTGLANVSAEAPPMLTEVSAPGWNKTEAFTPWVPHYLEPRASLTQTHKQADMPVSLFIGYYNRQHEHDELVTYNNQIVMMTDKLWATINPQQREVDVGQPLPVVEAEVRGPERLLVWKWYWINGRWTNSDYRAKALIALDMLLGRGDESAVLLLYTPVDAFDKNAAAQRLQAFARAAMPQIEQTLTRAASQ